MIISNTKKSRLFFFSLFLSKIFISSTAFAVDLKHKVFVGSVAGFEVTSTLIYGEKDAVLIDAQFTLADAHRLVAEILETGKNLKGIYITHGHPDHYWGAEVVKAAFPKAEIVAKPEVVAEIDRTKHEKLAFWKPKYGINLTSSPITPLAYNRDTYLLEGETLQILPARQGDDEFNTSIWVPSKKLLVTGDVVYNNAHVWVMDAVPNKHRAAWQVTLNELEALAPEIVVAGHKHKDAPDTVAAIDFTRRYLDYLQELIDDSATIQEIKERLPERFPEALGLQGIVGMIAEAFGVN